MKKLITVVMILVLCLVIWCALNDIAKAESIISGNYEYILLNDGTVEITHYNGVEAALSIPSTLDGHYVTRIGEKAFYYCKTITNVTIPDSVMTIEDQAFYMCTGMINITIPGSVTYIGRSAFEWCSGLTSVIIPDSLTIIEDDLFFLCSGLTSVTIPEGITEIGHSAFSGCSSLTSITIPDSVTIIGYNAFSSCSNLVSVTLSDNLMSIGDDAFSFCYNLTNVTIPDSVIEMGSNPFFSCDKLASIHVSSDHPYLAVIDGVLFSKPDKRLISYPHTLKEQSYSIPQGTKIIGKYSFDANYNLNNVTIPDSVEKIDVCAFFHCSHLDNIMIPNSVTSIGGRAFSGCLRLTSITIPDSVTLIGDEIFYDCGNVTVTVNRDSYAEQYCQYNYIQYTYSNNLNSYSEDSKVDEYYVEDIDLTIYFPHDYLCFYRNMSPNDYAIKYTNGKVETWDSFFNENPDAYLYLLDKSTFDYTILVTVDEVYATDFSKQSNEEILSIARKQWSIIQNNPEYTLLDYCLFETGQTKFIVSKQQRYNGTEEVIEWNAFCIENGIQYNLYFGAYDVSGENKQDQEIMKIISGMILFSSQNQEIEHKCIRVDCDFDESNLMTYSLRSSGIDITFPVYYDVLYKDIPQTSQVLKDHGFTRISLLRYLESIGSELIAYSAIDDSVISLYFDTSILGDYSDYSQIALLLYANSRLEEIKSVGFIDVDDDVLDCGQSTYIKYYFAQEAYGLTEYNILYETGIDNTCIFLRYSTIGTIDSATEEMIDDIVRSIEYKR